MTSPREQICTLLSLGFSHRDIARVASTSVHSTMMIARGEREKNLDTFRTSQIDQLYRLVTQVLCRPAWGIGDVPAWFETPILDGVPYTPMDLYVDGKLALVLEFAAKLNSADPESVLSEYDPAWRKFLDSEWETFTASDGDLAIRMKDGA
jgi:hypothetical protein